MLQVRIKDGFQWKENLSNVLLAICSTPHSTTSDKPFRKMTGRDMSVKKSTLQPPNLQGRKLQRTDVVRKAVQEVHRKTKERYDGKLQLRRTGLKKVILCAPNCHYKKNGEPIFETYAGKGVTQSTVTTMDERKWHSNRVVPCEETIIVFHSSQRTS